MPRKQLFDSRQCIGAIVHNVISSAPVNMKIDVTWRNHVIVEIG